MTHLLFAKVDGLSARAAGIALAATLVVLFILCAIVQVVAPNLQATHMWISLFTAAPIGSGQAWLEGIIASIVFGFIGGFLFAWVYNRAATHDHHDHDDHTH